MFKYAQIQTTSICNARCTICPYTSSKLAEEKGIMSDEVFRETLKQLRGYTLQKTALYMQNEPLTDPSYFDRLRAVRAELAYGYLEVSTNASLLIKRSRGALLAALKGSKCRVDISFHGIDKKTYELRTGLNFEKNEDHVKTFLVEAKEAGVATRIVTMVPKSFMEQFWKKHEVLPEVRSFVPNDRAGNIEGKGFRRQRGGLSCTRVRNWVHINWRGEVVLCCNDYQCETVIGSIMEKPLVELWSMIPEYVRERYDDSTFICNRCDERGV